MAQAAEVYFPRTAEHRCCVYVEQLNERHRQLQRETRRLQFIELFSLQDQAALGEVKASLEHHVMLLACLAPDTSRRLLDQYEERRREYDQAIAAPLHLPSVPSCTTPGMSLVMLVEKVSAHNDIIKRHFNTMLCHSFCIGPASHMYNQCSEMLSNLSQVEDHLRDYVHTHNALCLLQTLDRALGVACDALPLYEPPPASTAKPLGARGPFAALVHLLSGQLLGEEPVASTEPSVREERVAAMLPPPGPVGLPPALRSLLGTPPPAPIVRLLYHSPAPITSSRRSRTRCVRKLAVRCLDTYVQPSRHRSTPSYYFPIPAL